MSKLEQHRSENDKLEHALEMQQLKIRDQQNKLEELERLNLDNMSVIESLRLRNDDYKAAIEHKNISISQLEKVLSFLYRKNKFCY